MSFSRYNIFVAIDPYSKWYSSGFSLSSSESVTDTSIISLFIFKGFWWQRLDDHLLYPNWTELLVRNILHNWLKNSYYKIKSDGYFGITLRKKSKVNHEIDMIVMPINGQNSFFTPRKYSYKYGSKSTEEGQDSLYLL